jgi:tetratricopeptide (TPR) repeat protein
MDKVRRLKRYQRKDYSQVVDFPVEIVGRDGVVRRYSFEASVRLYQRRIALAPMRYEDDDVEEAEVQHCRKRIEQLRQSYLKRYGWSAIQGADEESSIGGEFAGEVAAFLRRYFGDPAELDAVHVKFVDDGSHHRLFFVNQPTMEDSYLLYLYRFNNHGGCEGRESFFKLLRIVQAAEGQRVERLMAFHHTADCGLVLTGVGESRGPALLPQLDEGESEGTDLPHFLGGRELDENTKQAMKHLGEGDLEGALRAFDMAVLANAFNRQAYVGVAVLADVLGKPQEAQAAARMALHYFPGDPTFRYHLGLALFRREQLPEACAELEAAADAPRTRFPARLLLGIYELKRRRRKEAWRRLRQALQVARPQDAEAVTSVRSILVALGLRAALQTSGWIAMLAGIGGLVASISGAGWLVPGGFLLAAIDAILPPIWPLSRERYRRIRVMPPEALSAPTRHAGN